MAQKEIRWQNCGGSSPGRGKKGEMVTRSGAGAGPTPVRDRPEGRRSASSRRRPSGPSGSSGTGPRFPSAGGHRSSSGISPPASLHSGSGALTRLPGRACPYHRGAR